MRIYKKTGAVIILFLLVFSLSSCGSEKQTETFYAMGSYITQTTYGAEKMLLKSIKSDIEQADANISHRNENSYISLLNKGKKAVFDKQTYNILFEAVEFCADTNGVFDVSLLSLTCLWDFDGESSHVPTPEEINTALQNIGYKNIVFGDNNTVSLKNDAKLDLGSLGKGYACDIAVQAYKEAGISGIISVGGSIGVNGMKPEGEYFNVGIRNPFSKDTNDVFAAITLKKGFVSTSGSYEKYFVEENVYYHHILDTSTGYPIENNLVSVSVVCENGMQSDILSTACYAMGVEDSLPLLKKYGAEAVFVTKDKKVLITEGLQYLVNMHSDMEVSYI